MCIKLRLSAKIPFSFCVSKVSFILLLSFAFSHIRECLKLDQDDKECFSHYKQVKKLSKQLDSAEELIQEERWVMVSNNYRSMNTFERCSKGC